MPSGMVWKLCLSAVWIAMLGAPKAAGSSSVPTLTITTPFAAGARDRSGVPQWPQNSRDAAA